MSTHSSGPTDKQRMRLLPLKGTDMLVCNVERGRIVSRFARATLVLVATIRQEWLTTQTNREQKKQNEPMPSGSSLPCKAGRLIVGTGAVALSASKTVSSLSLNALIADRRIAANGSFAHLLIIVHAR